MNDTRGDYMNNRRKKRNKRIIIGVFVVVILVSVIGFFVGRKQSRLEKTLSNSISMIEYYIIKKPISFVNDIFNEYNDLKDVYDENRNEAFIVEAEKYDIGKKINIYTPDKTSKLMYFRQQLRIGAHNYKVYDSNGMEIATLEKEFMVPRYNISGSLGRFVMSCDSAILGRNYTVEKDGFKIGEINKEWTFGRDRYTLKVIDEDYTVFLVGLLIMVDMVRFHSDN